MRLLLTLAGLALLAGACSSTGEAPVEGESGLTLLGPLEAEIGSVPRFEWSSLEGAATYRLVVLGADGPIWAWQGEQTSVNLGGLTGERPEAMPGPVVEAGTSWSVAAMDAFGTIIDVVGPIEISPSDSSSATPTDTPTSAAVATAADLPDPCDLVPQESVDEIFGRPGPQGEGRESPGPGGIAAGRSCSWSQGLPNFNVSVFLDPRFLTPLDVCDFCDAVDGLGEEAWAGETDRGSGGSMVAVVVDGMGVQLRADGLGVSKQELVDVAAIVLERMG